LQTLSLVTEPDARRLSSHAYEKLCDLILTGAVPAGHLLSERRLALHLGLSRTPLRDAMRQLEGERLLERLADGRVQVRAIAAADYIDNLNARGLIEGETAQLAAGRLPATVVSAFRARLQRLLDGPPPSADPVWGLDDELHDAIAVAAGSDRLRGMVRDLRREGHLIDPRRLPDRILPGTHEHLALLDALESGDPAAAAAAMRAHLENVKTDFLAHLAAGAGRR
jgi:DNA-binding GntR family transcriptional regulator